MRVTVGAMTKALTMEDFARAADALGCDVAAVRAVCEVEAPNGGFVEDGTGRPVVLFEGHKFHALTGGRFSEAHPAISFRRWDRRKYATGSNQTARQRGEWDRLAQAVALDRDAALQSASWGRFQIMGFNHEAAGHLTVQSFVNAMYQSEGAQLDAFVGFVRANGLAPALRTHDWRTFARKYNGSAYAANRYDAKLAQAYTKHLEAFS